LAAIRNTLEAMTAAGDAGGDLGERAWGVIDRQSRHMHRLVNDLLDVERIKRGRLQLSRQPVEICQCIRDAAEALRGQMESGGLELELDLPQRTMTVDADLERLVQIVDNLLRNSINYTDPGGRITVSARQQDRQVVIKVRDSGVGIDPEEAAELFEPYYQGEHGRMAKGLGLGLTLVKRLVEMHEGTIDVYSEGPGTGATFTLTLPLTRSEPAGPAPTVSQPEPLRVLVVDDQVDIADTFAALLEALGQRVEVAYDGEAALEVARHLHPQVAFLDLSMPGMDGHELARSLRQEYPPEQLTMIALTGFGSRHEVDGDEVFVHRLLKPADLDTVSGLLKSLTTRSSRSTAN
jgi:two-component system CheB/CheR fusion protein